MATELERLRKALAEAEDRASEQQRLREEAESRVVDEQRRREQAEEVAKSSQPLTLEPYLDACHSLSLAIDVVTDRSLTTQGDTTNPVGRIYPRRIVPWDDFPVVQEEIWNMLSEPSFTSRPAFPSQHQVDYVRSLISPISSEHGLRYFERDTVENAVQKLIGAVYENPLLRDRLGLRGAVTFESHTNLGATDDNLSEPLEHMSLIGGSAGDTAPAPAAAVRKPRRTARGKGHRADQFCIYRTSDGANVPTTAIEYKAPHKLSQDEVVTGLASEIQPARDVINKEGEGFVFASKALTAAVVTQLFSYMIGKGIQYGYVSTGQTFIFLYIPKDPTKVFYNVCVPNLDVLDDDENRLHRTAVAQVFAFIVQAIRTQPPPQSWHDAAESLDTWDVEFEDVLSKIPATVRKDTKRASPYIPQRWRGFTRSPIRTRLRCQQTSIEPSPQDDDEDEDAPPSPTPNRSTRSGRRPTASSTGSGRGTATSSASSATGRGGRGGRRQGIQDRPYCTHQCLLGLARGTPMDQSCPNAPCHGPSHIGLANFLHLLRVQLANDRGPDADSVPLYVTGAVGSLFKVRLSAHGYTLVAKGVKSANLGRLQHEEKVYNQLSTIQGRRVPVCLGLIDLKLPYYCDGGVFEHFLLLSWAGQPLSRCINQVDKAVAVDAITRAYTELHRLGVHHRDAETRNILCDQSLMIIDFERAEIRSRQPLGPISPNSQNREGEWGTPQKQGQNPFAEELQSVVESISRCFGVVATPNGMGVSTSRSSAHGIWETYPQAR
ncbi:hypothetical protein B0T24DRAFT_112663 [Lasiosphaeria ovina]|uniref:Protein kinase domain-containing protein n=1 Tax=Lasiosphaeria ovina TaxID=92902 RepID=A0AAE0JUE2_9PEZI|nr:hypothetical protein B0T24DRAFT_112663 [Lasiosphaeria ovina]